MIEAQERANEASTCFCCCDKMIKCRKTKTKIACFPDQSENWQMGHSQTFTSACSVVSKGLSDGIEPVWMKILPKPIFQLESCILTLNTQPRWVSALAPTQKREFIVKNWRPGVTSTTMKPGQKSNRWWSLGGNGCVASSRIQTWHHGCQL